MSRPRAWWRAGARGVGRPAALAAALAAATPGLARAYGIEHTASGAELHWTAFPVTWRADVDGVPTADRRWVLRTLRRGPESWTLPAASAASFDYAGTSSAGLATGDGVTTFTYVTQGWPADLGDGSITAAATLLTYDDTTGVVSEADVGVNAEGFRFADETPTADALDLWSISAHEAGHVLGLAHACGDAGQPACDPGDPVETRSLMYPAAVPGDVSRRVPSADDVAGLAHLYGPGDAAPPAGAVAPAACAGDPLLFVPATGSATPTAFSVVDADAGTVMPIFFSGEEDGDHLAASAPAGHVLDLVVTGASGKARTLYGALLPLTACAADGGTTPPAQAGCGCEPAPGGDASALALGGLALAAWLGLRRRDRERG